MSTPFPNQKFNDCRSFAEQYFAVTSDAVRSIDLTVLDAIAGLIKKTIDEDGIIYICGNGGSAAIANHSLCDFLKCVRTDTDLLPRIVSLSAHAEMNSALANDISHDEVFAYQLASMARTGDMLWTVSSSGNSENIVRALKVANDKGMESVSFTGFDGGRSRGLATLNAHVDAHNYGVVEDLHMSFIHIITQYLRMRHMDQALIGQRTF